MQKKAPEPPALDPQAILVLTDAGKRSLLEAGTTLNAAELEALVLIDDHATVVQVEKRVQEPAREALRARLADLVARGYVGTASRPSDGSIDPGDFFAKSAAADADTEFLRSNGYVVNLARRAAAERTAAPGARPISVLVVDDDEDIGMLLRKYLKLEGIETISAGTPTDIVAALRRVPSPDLVLLDIDLPGVDGFHVLRRIREHPRLREIPVIMVTATATREVVLKGLLLGADGHITKPFRIHALVRAVKAALGLAFDPAEQDWDLSL